MTDNVVLLPSVGFAPGTVVRHCDCEANMLVVYRRDDITGVIAIEQGQRGVPRLREFRSCDLRQLVPAGAGRIPCSAA